MYSTFLHKVDEERQRQISEEGHTADLDDTHNANGELALAASCYAIPESHIDEMFAFDPPCGWPWRNSAWKPTPNDRQRELVKAAALLNAEFDRLERLKHKNQTGVQDIEK